MSDLMTKHEMFAHMVALLSTMEECEGGPLGPAFMAFQARGISHFQFSLVQGALDSMGFLRVEANCGYVTQLGREFLAKVREKVPGL